MKINTQHTQAYETLQGQFLEASLEHTKMEGRKKEEERKEKGREGDRKNWRTLILVT